MESAYYYAVDGNRTEPPTTMKPSAKELNYSVDDALCQEIALTEAPQEILFSLFKRFKERAAIVTSGQLSGMVLIHHVPNLSLIHI